VTIEITRKRDVARLMLLVSAVAIVVPVSVVTLMLKPFAGEFPNQYRAILAIAILIPTLIAPPITYLLLRLIREMHVSVDRLNDHLKYDQLTGVFNRSHFLDLVRAARTDGALLIIDADHFKAINDTHGHDVGDDALKTLAGILAKTVGDAGHVGRLGGEEFGAFLPDHDAGKAAAVAEALCASVRVRGFLVDGASQPLTISIGGVIHEENTPIGHSLKLADERLYQAKRAGRDRYVGEVPVPKKSPRRLKQVS
jgi:diguanylate cyclase